MSRFYGQVEGMSRTIASRRGSKEIKASVQSWDASVITRMRYDDCRNLKVEIAISDDSSFYGKTYFCGTVEELKEKLGK